MKLNMISVAEGLALLKKKQVIAYPTEAVYGLGCDAFCEAAVHEILQLKQRPIEKGVILLIGTWHQLDALIQPLPDVYMDRVRATWPGPVTFVFPKSPKVPFYLSGSHETIAIRMSAHPIASALCAHGPIVSTSANLSGQDPAKSELDLLAQFSNGLTGVVEGELGKQEAPSQIIDVLTGEYLRL